MADPPETDPRLHDVVYLVRLRLARLRPTRLDADFERLIVEFTLLQLQEQRRLDAGEVSRLRAECDRLLAEFGTLRAVTA
jgi:hypothetical protein